MQSVSPSVVPRLQDGLEVGVEVGVDDGCDVGGNPNDEYIPPPSATAANTDPETEEHISIQFKVGATDSVQFRPATMQ